MHAPDLPIPNLLLASLPSETLARLRSHFEPLDLPLRKILFQMDDPLDHVYFSDGGMTSLLIPLEDGALLEVGVVGKEGAVGLGALMGVERAQHTAMVQIPSKGMRVRADILRAETHRSPDALHRLLRYTQALNAQVSQTAACNVHHTLQERLARWLLMAHDRAEGDDLPLTQEFLSMMLGVRRAGVTVAVNILEQTGSIASRRGRVTVLDRSRLETASCECYGMVQQQFKRLLG
ncbi:Crp/Fnr family transcriptional regulator [Arenibaculum pallidiluteum]|uniref:Crp/Fnr family transcriptional regulator n=1 Tax=Arenibaculum pallidiluteum TaxID=2812559 RepID=UPI001A96B549|nr:Crp/Fnr family transcriptional regulator [Arenibaculum pallidiluteum]